MKNFSACLFLFFIININLISQEKVMFPSGNTVLEKLDLLPLLAPNGSMTRQFISYDPSGGNGHGWSYWSRYTDLNGQWVIFDDRGPGCLYRLQMNVWHNPISPLAKIYFYFDDEIEPRLAMTFDQMFGKDQKYTELFKPPMCFFDDRSGVHGNNRFSILYHPFSFAKRLKITMDAQPPQDQKWYQFTYSIYPEGFPLKSWNEKNLIDNKTITMWNNLGKSADTTNGSKIVTGRLKLKPGDKGDLAKSNEKSLISRIRFHIEPFTPEVLSGIRIKFSFDDLTQPTIDMPLGSLLGIGGPPLKSTGEAWQKQLKSLMIGYDHQEKSGYLNWPMPFWKKFTIEIINESVKSEVDISATIVIEENNLPQDQSGYFFAKRTLDGPDDNALYTVAFEEFGWGKLVGLFFYSDNYNMDGDEFTFLDGSRTAQIHGDGTEDDHNQGWGGDAFHKPLWGGTINGYNGGYRFYLGDAYIFNQSIRKTYEHSLWGGRQKNVVTDVVCYYYKKPNGIGNLQLTDELDIGNIESEKKHEYTVTDKTEDITVASAYDGYEMKPKFDFLSNNGRSFIGTSQFKIKIDPKNQGVLLRRRIDKSTINIQSATVIVDGKVLSRPWYDCHLKAPSHQAWADSDYHIPQEFTNGKKTISIEIKYLDSSSPKLGINEFYYTVYCYGVAPLVPLTPQKFTATIDDGDNVLINWQPMMLATKGYQIERRNKNGGAFESLVLIEFGVNKFSDKNILPLTEYEYRIRAENDASVSSWVIATVITGPSKDMVNQAKFGVASSSSVYLDDKLNYSASQAIDGNLGTRWNSAANKIAGEWLSIKWSTPIMISTIKISQETFWTRISSYKLQYRNKEDWVTLKEGGDLEDVKIFVFPKVQAIEIRVLINNTTGNTPTIKEFEVY
jgi:hypothetical protein